MTDTDDKNAYYYLIKSYIFRVKNKNEKLLILQFCNNICAYYYKMHEHEMALVWVKKAIKIQKENDVQNKSMLNSYHNLACTLCELKKI